MKRVFYSFGGVTLAVLLTARHHSDCVPWAEGVSVCAQLQHCSAQLRAMQHAQRLQTITVAREISVPGHYTRVSWW